VEQEANSVAEYAYNGLGQRVIKQAGANTTVYHYDLDGKLIAESLLDGNMTREYLYMGKVRVAMVDVAGGNALYHYLNDHLGTPQAVTDGTGKSVWEALYKPFGEASVHPSSAIVNNFRFPGQYYDAETGLHYNYHRYYDPRTGRYMTPDPLHLGSVHLAKGNIATVLPAFLLYEYGLSNPQALNLYPYVENNPLNFHDPYGLFSIRSVLGNSRVKSIVSLGAAMLAEHAATKMEPGKARATVYAISGVLAFGSALEATKVAVASYVVATTTAPTVASAVVGYSVGTVFAGIAVYDLYLTNEYFQNAYRDFFYQATVDMDSCE
jgi:RHS repeat-associated protein